MNKQFHALFLFVSLIAFPTTTYPQNISIEKKIDSLRHALNDAELQRLKINDQIIKLQAEIQKNANLLSPVLRADGRRNVKCTTAAYLMSKPTYKSDIVSQIPSGTWFIVDESEKYSGGYLEAEYDGKKGYIYESMVQNQSSSNSLLSTPSKSNTGNNSSTTGATRSSARTYIRGPKGGCYYINSSGNKQYVDRSYCK